MKELIENNQQTMTLKEITDLLDVRHNNAIRTVEKMSKEAGFGSIQLMSIQYKSGKNTTQTIQTYQLNKRQSLAVASKLNTTLLMRIIDRWQELEAKEQPLTLEQMTLQVLTELQARVYEQQKQIESKNQLIIASNEASIKAGEISVREFVKTNDAINIGGNKFLDWLREEKFIFQGSRQPLQQYVDNGWFTWKFSEVEINGKKRRELKITPRGQLQLAKRYMKLRAFKLEQLEEALGN